MDEHKEKRDWSLNDSPKEQAERPIFEIPGGKSPENDTAGSMKEAGPYLTLGLQLAMFVVFGVVVGWYLDRGKESSFWTGILAAAGAVAGLVYFLVSVTRLEKAREKKMEKKMEKKR